MDNWQVAMRGVQELAARGVGEFVVCGGARNAILLEVLGQAGDAVKVWTHFEERSAGFYALGRTMVTGKPCAVVVTSGTAAAELFPAVMEGFYQHRPLVLVTADRPVAFRGSGAPQAVEQVGIFGDYAETRLEDWTGTGPLHVNLELGEGFAPAQLGAGEISVGEFEVETMRPNVGELSRWLREPSLRGLVVMLGYLEEAEKEEVFYFCESLGAPVIAEGTSGLREALQHLALVHSGLDLRENPPERVLRLGGVPSCRFWRDLENLEKVDVWSISRGGLRGLGRDCRVMAGDLARILPALGDIDEVGDVADRLDTVRARAERCEEALAAFPDSGPGWMRTLSIYASLGESVYLGNSLPIRDWNDYAQWERPVRAVRANRGANGIDGQVSSWLGSSAGEENAWGIFGDLTALYDVAGLKMLGQVERRGRVMVVINNGGGGIFRGIPRLAGMHPKAVGWMEAETPVDFQAFAAMWGVSFLRFDRSDLFEIPMESEEMLLVEVVVDGKQTEAFARALS